MTRRPPNKIKLNELTLQRLKPRARPYLVWNPLQHGLAISVQPSGSRAWKVIYSRHGRPRWYTIGRASAIGLSDARKLAGKIMVRVAEGEDPQADRRAERSAGDVRRTGREISRLRHEEKQELATGRRVGATAAVAALG